MEMKWYYEIPQGEMKNYKPEEVILAIDRIYGGYITMDSIFVISEPRPSDLKEPGIKD